MYCTNKSNLELSNVRTWGKNNLEPGFKTTCLKQVLLQIKVSNFYCEKIFFANLVLGKTKKNFACRYLLTYGTKRPKTKEQ